MYARIEVAENRDLIGDAELLRYFRRGDHSALDVLLARHRDALFRFCYHLTGNREDAEDVCQETLARAMTRVGMLQSDSAFRSWLFSIARNLSIDSHRRNKRTCAMPEDDAMPIQLYTETPEDRVEQAEERQTVAEVMGKLAQSHQRVLVLREVEGMSYADIAEEMDVSQSAVETLLFRARRRLKEEYHKSAAPALAFLTGLRDLVIQASVPQTGSTMAKLAVTAAVVSGVAFSVPHSQYTFPPLPKSAASVPRSIVLTGGHTPSSHSALSKAQRKTSQSSVFQAVAGSPAHGAPVQIAARTQPLRTSPKRSTHRARRSSHTRTRVRHARPSSKTHARKSARTIPPLPSRANIRTGKLTVGAPPPPPSSSTVAPSSSVSPSVPLAPAGAQPGTKRVAAVRTAAVAPPPPPALAPTAYVAPTSAPAQRPVRRNPAQQPPQRRQQAPARAHGGAPARSTAPAPPTLPSKHNAAGKTQTTSPYAVPSSAPTTAPQVYATRAPAVVAPSPATAPTTSAAVPPGKSSTGAPVNKPGNGNGPPATKPGNNGHHK